MTTFLSILQLFFLFCLIGCAYMFIKPSGPQDRKYSLLIALAIILLMVGDGTLNTHLTHKEAVRQARLDRPNLPGHKINKHKVKKDKDGYYYTDRADSNIHYFTDGGTITAIKYSFMPNPEHTPAVTSELANLLDDSHLKYGNDKVPDDKTLLKGDNYNVYSPKHKRWYHMSMQKDDDGKVSTFSVWPGKVSNAE